MKLNKCGVPPYKIVQDESLHVTQSMRVRIFFMFSDITKIRESGWYRGFIFVPLVLKGRFFYAFKTNQTKIFIEKEHMQ